MNNASYFLTDKPTDNIVTDAATILLYLNTLEFEIWASEVFTQGDLEGPLWDWDALAPAKVQLASPAPCTTLGNEEHTILC